MYKVENQKFYHIQRGPVPEGGYKWNIGRKTFWGKEKNFVINSTFKRGYAFSLPTSENKPVYYESISYLFNDMVRFIRTQQKHPRFAPYYHYDPKLAFLECYQVLYHHSYILREMIFEEVRKEINPTFPSRYTGLWVIKGNLEELQYWCETLSIDDKSTIVTLNLTGKIHEGNIEHLRQEAVFSVEEIRAQAFKYWHSSPGQNKFECLFEGYSTVEDVSSLDDLNLKRNKYNPANVLEAFSNVEQKFLEEEKRGKS